MSSTRSAVTAAVVTGSLALAVVGLAPSAGATTGAPTTATVTGSSAPLLARAPQMRVSRLIVRMRDGRVASTAVRTAAAARAGGGTARLVRRLATGDSLLALPTALSLADAAAAARALAARSDVLYAEPDRRMFAMSTSPVTPNDTDFGMQWDLWDPADTGGIEGGYSVKAPAVWPRTTGSPSVVVAVVDTGITDHPDLVGQTVPGYDFISDPLTANDGDGRDDDPHDPGDWITASESNGTDAATGTYFEGCPVDTSSWHGTHVSGTIAALQDNGQGVSGIAPGVKLEPVRVLGKCGGYSSDIADAIEWASGGTVSGVPANAHPAQVINLSLGGPGACDFDTQQAITDARSRGTTVVVAAGNGDSSGFGESVVSTSDANGSSPANCAGVIDVEATTRAGVLASYSNYGHVAGSTVIAAPGGDAHLGGDNILSTINLGTTVPGAAGYTDYAGTSMATPHVAAAAALLQSLRAGRTPYTPDQIASMLATDYSRAAPPSCTSCDAHDLDLDASPLPTFAPVPPSAVSVVANDGVVDLSWTPGDSGGLPTTVAVEQSTDGVNFTSAHVASPAAPISTARIDALTDEQPYWFRIVAQNTLGAASSPVVGPITPTAYVMAPPTVSGGIESLYASWSAPHGPVSGYAVRYRVLGSTVWTTIHEPPGSLTVAVTGLRAGAYEVQVAAVHGAATGPFTSSATASVGAQQQAVSLVTPVVYPFVDHYLDSLRLGVTSNVSAHGVVRVLSPRGSTVATLTLTPGLAWTPTWNGRSARGVLLPYGTYRAQVWLSGRSSSRPLLIATRSFVTRISQAGRPAITTSATDDLGRIAVWPRTTEFRDSAVLDASATVPARFTWTLLKGRSTVVWRHASTSRVVHSRVTFVGRDSHRHVLAPGAYTLVVTALGGEGRAYSRSKTVVIEATKLHRIAFTRTIAGDALQVDARGGSSLGTATDGDVGPSGNGSADVLLDLPSGVRAPTGLRATVCGGVASDEGGSATAAYARYAGATLAPPVGLSTATGACTALGDVPAAAVAPGVLNATIDLLVRNSGPALDLFPVARVTVTGYRYLAR